MRVLVTGHLGYVGVVLTPMLQAAGHAVVGLDSDLYRNSTFGGAENLPTVPNLEKDVRDVEAADLEGIDAIVHLAALSNDPLGDLNPQLTYDINHLGTVRLATLAKQVGVKRFIFSSSCSNYGAGVESWLTEESAFNPVTPYGISKVRSEQDLLKLADDDFSPVFTRSATAYGVSCRLRFDLVLNNLTAWAYTTGKVHLKSDGSAWRPIVHIEDMARAFTAILHAPQEKIHAQAFNVGRTDENYTIREIAQIVAETVPNSTVRFAEDASPDKRNYRVNCDKIINTLPEFKPQWTARKGAQEVYAALQKHGVTLDEFEGTRYKRVGQIKGLIESGQLDENLRWRTAEAVA